MSARKRAFGSWFAILILLPAAAFGYGNDGPGGGAHRRLNAVALSRFIQAAAKDPILRHYDFRPTLERFGLPASSRLFLMESKTVTRSGAWHRHEPLWPGVTATFIEEGLVRSPFAWWVEEGGYTADEPESYMALRHFYDPLARAYDVENGVRCSYLTDALDPWMSPLLMGHNPRQDAKTWATSASPYSWARARQGLDYIDALDFADPDRGKEFGAVWRSLGEVLHLVADMTLPAHVRNDAHPGAWWPKTLAGDPYEDYVTAGVVSRCAAGPAPEAVRSMLKGVRDPGSLMHGLALFTNRFFFSKDTIVGRDGATGEPVDPANGAAAYPAPRLEFYKFDPAGGGIGFYNTPNGLFAAAQRMGDGSHTVGSPTATGQALALIPAAVEAEVKLIDLFLPRVRVIIDGFDAASRRLRFHSVRLEADETGAYRGEGLPARLWSSPEAVVFLTIGGKRRAAAVHIEPGQGAGLILDLSAVLDAAAGSAGPGKPVEASCAVGLDMGGILVGSETIGLTLPAADVPPKPDGSPAGDKPAGESVLGLLRSCIGVQAAVYGKFPGQGSKLEHSTNEIKAGNYDWFTRQDLRRRFPLRWTGTRFAASYSYSEKGTPTFQNPDPVITYTGSLSGRVSDDGRTLVELSITNAVSSPGGEQRTSIRLIGVPLESRKSGAGRIEVVFRTASAAAVSADYVNKVFEDPLGYYSWTASTGSGVFDQVRIWFVN